MAQTCRKHVVSEATYYKWKSKNALIERFNRIFRTEVLDRNVFESLEQAQRMSNDWHLRYNHQRTHRALGKMRPIQ